MGSQAEGGQRRRIICGLKRTKGSRLMPQNGVVLQHPWLRLPELHGFAHLPQMPHGPCAKLHRRAGLGGLGPKLRGKPPAEPPAQRRVTLSPSQRPAAQRPAPSPAAAKTPVQRARVTLELAIASGYPEAVLDEMRAHIDELLRRDREAKPLRATIRPSE